MRSTAPLISSPSSFLLILSTGTGPRKVLTEWRHFYAGTDPKQLEAASPSLHSVAGLPSALFTHQAFKKVIHVFSLCKMRVNCFDNVWQIVFQHPSDRL
ncbi:hypothetical protein AC1031_018052 [Aphanomyces cochlioides]|nr:hypothetical protein AC1031_018052 [Aphanomyces cochlioides]